MKLVGLGVDATAKTRAWGAWGTCTDTSSLGAVLALWAEIPAVSAVCRIGLDINAAFVAFELPCGAFADRVVAKLPVGTGLAASAAV